jgi:rubrerythrin
MAAMADSATSFLERARVRRRVAYLRRRRELGLRELGLAVLEEGDVEARTAALRAIDEELTTLEQALGERRELAVLREPGIAVCPQCQTIHGSDANYCPNCGEKRVRRRQSGRARPA